MWFRSYISNIGLTKLLYISIETGPEISMTNKFQCFVLTKVTSKNVIMIILENVCIEITSRWYVDFIIKTEKTVRIYKLLDICGDVFCISWVTRKSQKDISVQNVEINHCSCTNRRKKKDSSLYKGHKLFLSEDWFEVIKVDYSIASIPLFRVNVPLSSESVWFGAKTTRIEPNNKIELREILRPLCLPLGQYLGSRKTLKIFIICNNINEIGQTL